METLLQILVVWFVLGVATVVAYNIGKETWRNR